MDLIEELGYNEYKYHMDGDVVVVTQRGGLVLTNVEQITTDVVFKNDGFVDLYKLEQLKTDVRFENRGYVDLPNLQQITGNVVFKNRDGIVYLKNIQQITGNVEFNNGNVYTKNYKLVADGILPEDTTISLGEFKVFKSKLMGK